MTFFIPEFWVGVLATLSVEILGIFIIGIYNSYKIKKNKGDRK